MSDTRAEITIDYDCTPAERAEAEALLSGVKTAGGTSTVRFSSTGQNVFGWVLFIALAVMLFFLVRGQGDLDRQSRDAPAGNDIVAAYVALGIGVACVIAAILLLKASRRAQLAELRGRVRCTFGTRGVTYSLPHRRETLRWDVFFKFDEAANVLLLRHEPKRALTFPRRLFTPEQYDAVVRMLRERLIRPAIPQALGFPVQTDEA